MSLATDLITLKSQLDSFDVDYETFLDLTDPANPDSVFSDALEHFSAILNDPDFADTPSSFQKDVRDQFNILMGYAGDDASSAEAVQFKRLFEELGLDPATMRQHRALLRNATPGVDAMTPVLDFSKDGFPQWTIKPSLELTPERMSQNNLVRTEVYNSKGLPQSLIVAGYQPNSEEQVYFATLPQVGQLRIEKSGTPDVPPTVINQSTGRTESVQGTLNPISQQQEYTLGVEMNPGARQFAESRKQQITKAYSDMMGGAKPSETWMRSKIQDGAPLDEVIREIATSDGYLRRSELLKMSIAPSLPQTPQQVPIPTTSPVPVLQPGQQSRNVPTPGMSGAGAVPQSSEVRPGMSSERPGGIPQLSTVRNAFRNLRV